MQIILFNLYTFFSKVNLFTKFGRPLALSSTLNFFLKLVKIFFYNKKKHCNFIAEFENVIKF